MNWRRVWVSLLCISFTLLLFDNVFAQDSTRQLSRRPRRTGPPVGEAVKDFELPILGEGTFKLSEQKGKIVVIELGACT